MFKKTEDIQIPKDNPFANDILERKDCADNLTQMIQATPQPFVLSINGTWGSGKTTFLNMWKQSLENQGHLCLYFNAWENDFSESPLFSFIAEIENSIAPSEAKKGKIKTFLGKLKTESGNILRKGVPLAVKIASQGLIDWDKISDTTEKDIAKFLGKLADEKIKEYQKEKNSLKAFRESLKSLSQEITSDGKSHKSPTIIFVDELDRCRPNFAIELLETIKHLFSVEGIVFVLGTNMGQLAHSIKVIYGQDMLAESYLKRFVDYEFKLPDPPNDKYCKFLYKSFDLDSYFSKRKEGNFQKDSTLEALNGISIAFDLSLRDINQIMSQVNLTLRLIPHNEFLLGEFLIFLIIIKNKFPSLYKDICEFKKPYKDVIQYCKDQKPALEFFSSNPWKLIEDGLTYSNIYLSQKNLDRNLNQDTQKGNLYRHWFHHLPSGNPLHYLKRKIDFTEQFKP
jgi:hypothetical protein